MPPLLLAMSLAAVGLSVVDPRFAAVTAIASLLAGRGMGRVWPALVGFAVLVVAGVLTTVAVPSAISVDTVAVAVFAGMVPWLIGVAWRQSTELARSGWERVGQLEREQRLVAEQARLRERARIAQDMHDELGHELSLIALRAGALKLAPGLADRHRGAAGELRASAAAAVERLGEVVGVLRETAGDSPVTAAETSISALVERAVAAGADVDLTIDGVPPGAAVTHDRALHRVVQEALTNVAKHAPGAAASVAVRYDATETEVRVVNGLAPPSTAHRPAGGLGLVGLHERVRLAGGTFEAGPRGDGWAVAARLPHASQPVRALPTAPADERRQARRKVSGAVLALVTLPLVTFAALSVGLWRWTAHVTGQAVLAPEAYASLRVGQTRTEIASRLPGRQTPARPETPAPSGAACEYYAITADRFDSRSGDAYRLCFRNGILTTLDILTG